MKIAIATSFPRNPAAPHGGVEAVSVSLVKSLAGIPEVEVHVVTTHRDTTKVVVENWIGASIHRLPARPQKMLAYATGEGRRQVHSYLQQLAPDVVHAHDTYGIMVKGLSLPRVFTVHGYIHEDTRYGRGCSGWLRSLLWGRVEIAAWRDQPHIVSISPYVRERLSRLVEGVIHDIENPIAEEYFNLCRSHSEPVIFSAAVICERKNTLGLVRAFHRLRASGVSARLRLAGKIYDPAYGQAVEDCIRENGLGADVDLLGSLNAAQVRQELTRASMFALVSFEEGAPMGVAEAMAAGVPVVASNRCGMPYMIRHAETGFLVNPNRPEEAAEAFGRLIADDSLRERMGKRAREKALECYHPDRVAERTFQVYQRAVSDFHRG